MGLHKNAAVLAWGANTTTTSSSHVVGFQQLLILAASVVAVIIFRRRYLSPISHIPGPFVGSISRWWHLRHIFAGNQQEAIAEAHEQYGPFLRLAHDEVSVAHPDAVKALLMPTLKKADWYKIFVIPDYRTNGPLSIQDPKDKRELNKHFKPGFEHSNILRNEPHMDDVLLKLFSRLDKAAENFEAIRMGDWFSYTAYDITGELTFSKSFGFVDKGEDIEGSIANMEQMELAFTVLGYFRWFSYLICNPFTTYLEIMPLGHMGAIAHRALEERKKNPDARFDMAAYWFRGLERVKGEPEKERHWNDRRILAAAISNLGAGSDTVSCAMQSFVYHMIRNPGCWKKACDEIDAARAAGRCLNRVITHEDAQQLPYLQASLKECLRIFSPIPMGLPRVAPEGGVSIGGNVFPEGTVLSVNPYVLMTSKSLWGPDADRFMPERWLEPGAEALEKYFAPWGAGWASCPGQHLARVQMNKTAATLVRDYDIRQVNPEEKWEWKAFFTLVPHGWPVYVSKRS